jgi:hypothetical protein
LLRANANAFDLGVVAVEGNEAEASLPSYALLRARRRQSDRRARPVAFDRGLCMLSVFPDEHLDVDLCQRGYARARDDVVGGSHSVDAGAQKPPAVVALAG